MGIPTSVEIVGGMAKDGQAMSEEKGRQQKAGMAEEKGRQQKIGRHGRREGQAMAEEVKGRMTEDIFCPFYHLA
jgi:hypothetical protein